MSLQIPESDWKVFRQLHGVALARFYERTVAEFGRICADESRTPEVRYHELSELVRERDRGLARAFDDVRRSTALIQLKVIVSTDLLRPEELERLSPGTRESIARWME